MKITGNKFRYFIDGVEVFDFKTFNEKFENKEIAIMVENYNIYGETI